MSRTSMDGIEVAILDTDGESIAAFGPTHFEPYGPEMREALRAAMERAASLPTAGPLPTGFCNLERELTQAHARAAGD